jgi:WD40 repeat protein
MDIAAATGTTLRWPRYPYPGLRPFRLTADADESLIFYGRETNKDDVLERLNESQLVSVVGPSGCGKSSLVKVGVIPALMAGFLTRAGHDWETIQMRPGQAPLGNLAAALAELSDTAAAGPAMGVEQIGALLAAERSALWALMEHLAASTRRDTALTRPRRVLLLMDQFEEIFSGVQNGREVDQFVGLLTQFFRRPHPRLYVILTMRTDFISQCANFPGLAEILNKTQYITPVLRGQSLEDAVARPAEAYGGEIEPALVREIMRDMGAGSSYDADHLPLMQHALLWLWQQAWLRNGNAEPPRPDLPAADHSAPLVLSLGEYEAHERLHGILNRHAEQILAHVMSGSDGERHGRVAEIMFRRLSERDMSMRYKRAPAYASEICHLAECSPGELDAVINPFADQDASFVERRTEARPDDPLLDLSHESLIRQWHRLRAWTDAEAEKLAVFRKITDEAEHWAQQGRSRSYLKMGGQLGVLQEWWEASRPTQIWAGRYSAVEGKAGQLSDRFALIEEFRSQSVRADKHRRRMRVAGLAAPFLLVALGGSAFYWSQVQAAKAIAETKTKTQIGAMALQGRLERSDDRATKALEIALGYLAVPKFDRYPQVEALAYDALQHLRETRIIANAGPASSVDYSPDGRWVIGSGEGQVRILDTSQGNLHTLNVPNNRYWNVRWSARGDRVLLAAWDKTALIVPLDMSGAAPTNAPDRLIRLEGPLGVGAKVGTAVFSPDGSKVATGGNGFPLRIWDAGNGEILASQDDGDASDGFALALNSDNTLLAAANRQGGISIYKLEGGHIVGPQPLSQESGENDQNMTRSLSFHPTQSNLLLFVRGTAVGILDVSTGELRVRVHTHGRIVNQAVFNADGTLIATSMEGGIVRVWRAGPDGKSAELAATFGEHTGNVFGVRFSPDGQHVASAGRDDRTIRIWTIDPALRPMVRDAAAGAVVPASVPVISERQSDGDLRVRDSHGSWITLGGVPDRFTPDVEAELGPWILLAPKPQAESSPNARENRRSLSEQRDPLLFRRNEPGAPVAFLESAGQPVRWTAFAITTDGHIVGQTDDGHEYRWQVFADRNALISFARAHLPVEVTKAGTAQVKLSDRDSCLVGLASDEQCRSALLGFE